MSESKNPQPSKVAEAVATYGRATPAHGVPSSLKPYKIASIEAPDAVWEFAKKHDLFPYLEMGIQWVREFFPSVSKITLEYGIDDHVEGNACIEINVFVSGAVEEIFGQYQQLNQQRTRHAPFEKSEKMTFLIWWA